MPVIVLHGWGGRIESMSPVIHCLAGAFRVLALDLPGFGESPVPAGGWGTPDYAAYVRDVIVAEGIEKAHFVGHSFGAKTALCLAATHPEIAVKVVAAASSGLRMPPSVGARARRIASRGARAAGRLGAPGSALRDAVYKRIASSDYREAGPMRPTLVKVVNEDLSDQLRRVASPTLLIWGSSDDAVSLAQAKRMEQLIPDAGLVVFEDAGHFAFLDDPQRFCRVIRHFLGAPLA